MAEVDLLPEIIHKYGSLMEVPDYPCLMTYKNEGNLEGSISFTRNTHKHPLLLSLVEYSFFIFKSIFVSDFPIIKERIHILRTQGNIPVHKDESNRKCCINIGLKNSAGAKTFTSSEYKIENFYSSCLTHIAQDGYGYLLNTNEFHSVRSTNNDFRYLITYGFGADFLSIKEKLNAAHRIY
jgi:hypothetical protein